MKVLVGTASWSDKSLVASKKFYPKEASTPEARLRFYATQFPLVEVDTSYYAIPLAETAQAWADRTPAHFTLNVKAFRLFTGHATSPSVLPPDLRAELPETQKPNFYFKDVPTPLRDAIWQRFKDSLEPLRTAGKLGMVHFQFAPWILRNRDGHAHVARCVEVMKDYTLSVEFRNFCALKRYVPWPSARRISAGRTAVEQAHNGWSRHSMASPSTWQMGDCHAGPLLPPPRYRRLHPSALARPADRAIRLLARRSKGIERLGLDAREHTASVQRFRLPPRRHLARAASGARAALRRRVDAHQGTKLPQQRGALRDALQGVGPSRATARAHRARAREGASHCRNAVPGWRAWLLPLPAR